SFSSSGTTSSISSVGGLGFGSVVSWFENRPHPANKMDNIENDNHLYCFLIILFTPRIIYLSSYNIFILSSFLIVLGAFTPMGVKNLCEFFYAFPPHFDNFCFG